MLWNSPAFRLVGIGWYFVTAIVVPTLIGRWLDGRFDSEPVWTLVMLLVGLMAAFYGAFVQFREFQRAQEERARQEGKR